ncbi:MAG: Pvc16 family protein [Blastocatellia bacterium]
MMQRAVQTHETLDIVEAIHTSVHCLFNRRHQNVEENTCFDIPIKHWLEALTHPTLNFYLFDIQENTDLRQTDWLPPQTNGKSATRRMPPRRFDLRFMVSAFADDIETEHQLLWWTLRTLLQNPELPPPDWREKWKGKLLPEVFAQLDALEAPLPARIGDKEDSARLLDLWGALEAPPRPALVYIVTAPMDLEIGQEAPLIFTRKLRYGDITGGGGKDERYHIGGVVRDKHAEPVAGALVKVEMQAAASGKQPGDWTEVFVRTVERHAREVSCRTDAQGRFVLPSVPAPPGGEVTLSIQHQGKVWFRKMVVPSDSYDIELDV